MDPIGALTQPDSGTTTAQPPFAAPFCSTFRSPFGCGFCEDEKAGNCQAFDLKLGECLWNVEVVCRQPSKTGTREWSTKKVKICRNCAARFLRIIAEENSL